MIPRTWLNFALCATAACSGTGEPTSGGDPLPAPARVGPAEDLFGDSRLAFHAAGGAFTAWHDTHEALVRGGALRVTPRHWTGETFQVGRPVEFSTAAIRRGG